MVTELTSETYRTEIESSTPIIIDFWAEWCGPCKMMAPAFMELSKEYAGKLKFAKVDTEQFPQLAAENDISGIPCLVLFKNGTEVDRIIGFSPKPMLKQKIDIILKKL